MTKVFNSKVDRYLRRLLAWQFSDAKTENSLRNAAIIVHSWKGPYTEP